MSETSKPSDQSFSMAASLREMAEKIDIFDHSVQAVKAGGEIDGVQIAEKDVQESVEAAKAKLKPEANPERVQAIYEWLESKTSASSTTPLSELADGAPEGITESDLQEVFINIKPRENSSLGFSDDIRGYYITALAHKIIGTKIEKWQRRNPDASEKDLWDIPFFTSVELTHPEIGEYNWDKMKNIGCRWERGVLVLKGNFGENVAVGMKGGEIVVWGNVGPRAGALMEEGTLDVMESAAYGLGYGMRGGSIHAKKSAPGVGEKMHGGFISIWEPIDYHLPGPNNVISKDPMIGIGREDGIIVVAGEEF